MLRGRDGLHADERRFQREAAILRELRHPGIVAYVAHGRTLSGRLYLAMEWLEGETLSHRLARGCLTLAETVTLGERTARYAPVWRTRTACSIGTSSRATYFWRVAASTTSGCSTSASLGCSVRSTSSPAPAISWGPRAISRPSKRAGIAISIDAPICFSLGAVLFRCLTGHAPFEADDLVTVLAKLVYENAAAPRHLETRRTESARVFDRLHARPNAVGSAGRRCARRSRARGDRRHARCGGHADAGAPDPQAPARRTHATRAQDELFSRS
jgi:serine/threonine protein kinase